MTRIHEGLEYKEFEQPASVENTSVCEETGLLPRAGCPVITEYFDVGTLPTEYCDQHFYEPPEEEEFIEYEVTPTPEGEMPDPENPDGNGDSQGGDGNGENPGGGDDGSGENPDGDGDGDGGSGNGENPGGGDDGSGENPDGGGDDITYYD